MLHTAIQYATHKPDLPSAVSKPDVYAQHQRAFAQVSAYLVLDANKEVVARITFKFPRPGHGEGRLNAFVHWLGTQMLKGHASGYGHDKRTAACWEAACYADIGIGQSSPRARFWQALHHDSGHTWEAQLRKAGFTVLQAV